jgi:hypothetical protein
MPEPLLDLPAACAAIDAQRRDRRATSVGIPRRVMQYWDREPPPQISRLIERTAEVCARHGVAHVLFDDRQARQMLVREGADVPLRAYDAAVHPAMKCDVFRLFWLERVGGHYVDADIVLRPGCGPLFDEPGDVLVFQWDSKGLSNLCNWLIGAAPGHPALAAALRATAESVLQACAADPQLALKNILNVSGPGVFTRGVGSWLAAHAPTPQAATLNVQTVSFAHRMIQIGPQYLKAPLTYKADERHWASAAEGAADGAPATSPSPAATTARAPWWHRLAARLRPARPR